MDMSTFLHHLDSHGGDPGLWPAEARAGVEGLLAASAPARAALTATVEFERLLRATAARPVAGSPGVDALAARAARHPQGRAVPRVTRPAARAMFTAAAVATLCLGLALGREQGQGDDGPDRALAVAFDQAGAVDVD